MKFVQFFLLILLYFMFGIKILFFEKNGSILGQYFICPGVFIGRITTKNLFLCSWEITLYIAAGSCLRIKKASQKQASQQVFGTSYFVRALANFSNPPYWKRHLLAANNVLKIFRFPFFFRINMPNPNDKNPSNIFVFSKSSDERGRFNEAWVNE